LYSLLQLKSNPNLGAEFKCGNWRTALIGKAHPFTKPAKARFNFHS